MYAATIKEWQKRMKNKAMIPKVKETITRHNLLSNDGRTVIVALSGGADSVALLASLCKLKYNCIAAHCNFHLRGEESNRDEAHARSIAHSFNCKIEVSDFDVEKYCTEQKESSVEVACRDLRYRWFEELCTKYNAQAIAVGHNSDDNCETLLFNLLRGSGIAGMHGIAYKNSRNVVRPLLDCSREDIESFLAECKLKFITDSSNLTTDYSRNKIRNVILPEVEKWFPTARIGIQRSISNISQQEALYNQCVWEKKRIYSNTEGLIDLSALIATEPNAGLLLYEWHKELGMTRTQADDIVKSNESTGAKFVSENYIWVINRGSLYQYSASMMIAENSPEIEDYFRITEHPIAEFKPDKDHNVAYFDRAVLSGTPLSVRFMIDGDSIKPFGMQGRKKVSDLMTENNVPLIMKRHIPLLVKGDEILWIAGIRASSNFKVSNKSETFIRIQYLVK